jgi:4-amino-4-deoxy-L-arabinose transferase-like glycosyltransferase
MAVSTFWRALAAIAAAGVVIRVLYTLLEAPWPPPGLDDQFYFSALPRLVADGEGFVNPFLFVLKGGVSLPTAEHPPLHTIVLAGLAELGGTSADAQRLTGAVFGAGTIVVVALLARRLAGDRAGLVAAGLAAVYPVLVATDGALMSESLYVVLVGAGLLAALRLADAPQTFRPTGAVLLGAFVALAALTRSEALLMLPLVVLGLLRTRPGRRTFAVAVIAFAVVLTPWTVRTWSAFDQPVAISTNSGSAIGGANCRETYYGDQLGGWQPQCLPDRGRGNEAEHMARLRRDGVRYARDHVGRLPTVVAVRLARVWNVYDPLQLPEGRSARAEKLGVAMYFPLVALALAGALILRHRRRELWILAVPVVLVCVTALLTYGNQRFRAPAELTLVVLAAVAIDAVWRARRAA